MIPFNKPYLVGKELFYIAQSVLSGQISGNGKYTKKCHRFFHEECGFKKTLLTTSCTDALEMCALLLDIAPGDEVIMPSYTFVSTALAFVRQGAVIKFVDSRSDHPGIDESLIESLITEKTKAIVAVHYAGVACDMDAIMEIAERHDIKVIEDAAQAIFSNYKGKPLGSFGSMAAFSFHETKNIQCGEGGLLVINDEEFAKRAEIIWEKGTNRAAFFRGEVNKYGWVDTGSSFLPSDMVAAFLYAQLKSGTKIQERRISLWNRYNTVLKKYEEKGLLRLPYVPEFATNNAHMYYMVFKSPELRTRFISGMKKREVHTVFHYLSLHNSEFYNKKHDGRILEWSDTYSDCLVRLPLFYELEKDIEHVLTALDDVLTSF